MNPDLRLTLGLSSWIQVVWSGQLQMLRTGSNIRVPGQDWVAGEPLLHLKYFLQFVSSGSSSPSWEHLSRLWAGSNRDELSSVFSVIVVTALSSGQNEMR